MAEPARAGDAAIDTSPLLVPVEVSRRKLEREVDEWDACADLYLRRGWRLRRVAELRIEVLFLASVPVDPATQLTVVAPCVQLNFDNYDLKPPSVRFVDPISGAPRPPGIGAFLTSEHGDRDVLLNPHPDTGLPFLCLPGVREYHDHAQHTGDDWLLHRGRGEGRLAVICERIWRAMPRTLIGLEVQTRWTPPVNELQVRLMQGKREELEALAAQMGAVQDASPHPALAEQDLRLAAQVVDRPLSDRASTPNSEESV